MKRLLLGLGSALLIPVGLCAQETAPAAKLGRPGEPTIRAQSPDVQTAAGLETPKPMPKGAVTESPAKTGTHSLPAPSPAPGTLAGPVPVVPPGATIVGPVVTEPYNPPMPSGPPIVGDPFLPGLNNEHDSDPSNWYVGVEALMFWVKSYRTPPLVTSGPAGSGANMSTPGVVTLFGTGKVGDNPRYGGRLTLGYWLNPCWAVELSGFYLRSDDYTSSFNSDQTAGDLARPFFDINNGVESSEIVGRPGVASGGVDITTRSTVLGLELNARKKWWSDCANRLDLIGGFRYLLLADELKIAEQSTGLAGAGPLAGVGFSVKDEFKTTNQFFGLQIGAIFQHVEGPWTFEIRGKIAAGVTRQEVNIEGSATPISGSVAPNQIGGLLALSSNIGTHTQNVFGVVPEVGLNVGYDITPSLRVFAGYSVLYWSDVLRAGKQIDRRIDINQIPNFTATPGITSPYPAVMNNSQSVWIQGVNLGFVYKW